MVIMAHFAKIENNTVTSVIVISNEVCDGGDYPKSELAGQAFIADVLKLDGEWLQTSYNANFRGCYAGIGYTYDPDLNEFVPPTNQNNNNDKQEN